MNVTQKRQIVPMCVVSFVQCFKQVMMGLGFQTLVLVHRKHLTREEELTLTLCWQKKSLENINYYYYCCY